VMMIGIGIGVADSNLLSLNGKALSILKKFGADAHVYIPGIGYVGGFAAGNYLDSVLTTAATIDNPVGGVTDAIGNIDAKQSTTANKPILRSAGGKYRWQFDGSTDILVLDGPLFNQSDNHCVISSAKLSSATLARSLFVQTDGGTNRVCTIYFSSGAWRGRWVGATASLEIQGASTSVNQVRIVSARHVSGVRSFRQDGVIQGSTALNPGAVTSTAASIGAFPTSVNYLAGDIGPVVAIKGTVSDADLLTLERWVSSLTLDGPVF